MEKQKSIEAKTHKSRKQKSKKQRSRKAKKQRSRETEIQNKCPKPKTEKNEFPNSKKIALQSHLVTMLGINS